jgi:succinate-semialdehyde dehydrogenase/glutarate-semialdehyde dehydrogenase
MGKPLSESRGELDKSIKHIKYYINNAKSFLHYKEIKFENFENRVEYEPMGPILNITPWNFPIWVPFKSVIPCLVAGNTVIQKPASRVPESSLFIEKLFKESGFDDAFQVTLIQHETLEENVFPDFRIRAAIFTGSTKIGKKVGELCGRYLKKPLLELGGSDPLIVLDDADLTKAVEFSVEGRLRNTGQACICAKRIIIHESLYDSFVEKLKVEVKKYHLGDPMDPSTKLGPIARFDLFLNLKRQVIDTINTNSASLIIYEENKSEKDILEEIDCKYSIENGNFFKPLIFTNIQKGCLLREEEIFGPVFSLYKFKNIDDAISISNESEYGLGASIFTKDHEKGIQIAKKIDCGMVFINSSTISDSRLPYGGCKNSGFGRTSADNALYEFTNNKVISIRKK